MRVSDLKKNIAKIEKYFLPPQNPMGTYSTKEILYINAYISLVHSEIENFLESEVLQVCKLSIELYKSTGKINEVILGLLCFSGVTYDEPPETKKNIKKITDWDYKTQINKKIEKAQEIFNYKIRQQNNGIKEKDILNMLLPIGYNLDDIDDIFLTEMNEFGKQRGKIAHTSNITNIATNQIDPHTMKNRIKGIIKNLETIENTISSKIKPLRLT